MTEIEYNVDWFKGQVAQWEEFHAKMYFYWWNFGMSADLPQLNERFPDGLKELVPKLNSVKDKMIDNLHQGETEINAMKDAMVTTVKQYIENNAANQDQVQQLKEEIES